MPTVSQEIFVQHAQNKIRPCLARKKNGIFLTFRAFFHNKNIKKWSHVWHARKMAFFLIYYHFFICHFFVESVNS